MICTNETVAPAVTIVPSGNVFACIPNPDSWRYMTVIERDNAVKTCVEILVENLYEMLSNAPLHESFTMIHDWEIEIDVNDNGIPRVSRFVIDRVNMLVENLNELFTRIKATLLSMFV